LSDILPDKSNTVERTVLLGVPASRSEKQGNLEQEGLVQEEYGASITGCWQDRFFEKVAGWSTVQSNTYSPPE